MAAMEPITNAFSTSSPVTPAKRLVFTLLLIACVYAFTEIAAVLTYRLSFGEPFSFSRLAAERAAIEHEEIVFEDTGRTGRGEVIHPYVGYVRNPEIANGSVNVYGLIGQISPIQSRKPGQLIVAITGGSVARQFFGQGVPTLEKLLRTSPRLADVRFVFVPLAIPGYKEPQQLMLVTYLLTLGAQFDWIINLDGFNEVALHHAENGRKGVFPAYPRNWYLRVKGLPDPPSQLLLAELAQAVRRRHGWAERFSRSPLRYSVTANLIWRVGDLRRARTAMDAEQVLRVFKPRAPSYRATGPGTVTLSEAEQSEMLADIWQNASVQLDRLSRENGIRYFHFLQPNQYLPGAKPMGVAERRVAFDPSHPYRVGAEDGYPRLIQRGRKLVDMGAHFVDLTSIFARVTEPIFVDTCCHINRRGNALLAAAMARSILSELGDPASDLSPGANAGWAPIAKVVHAGRPDHGQ